jgi:Rrf2 family nitric oxide-sensitive transcriptional repressor
MRLTVYTDYSLRVLMFLAVRGEELATIAEIAEAYAISKNHLMKVAHQLGLAGYVETVRGKGGGLRLARRPQDIVLGDVVRRTEPDMTLVPCFDPYDRSCAIFPGCVLRGVLGDARDAFLTVLDRHSLADLVRSRASLQKALAAKANVPAAARQPGRRAQARSSASAPRR